MYKTVTMDQELTKIDPPEVGDDSLKTIVFHSLLVGLTPFIPVPFLDDWARGMIMRRLYRQLLANNGFEDPGKGAALLYDEPTTVGGCLWIVITFPWFLFKKTVLWAIKKVLKLIIFVFIIDECANLMSEAFHQGYLVSYLLRTGALTQETASDEMLTQERGRIEKTCAHLDTKLLRKMVKQVFRDSPGLVKQAGSLLKKAGGSLKTMLTSWSLPQELQEDSKDGVLRKLTDRVLEKLKDMPEYLTSIELAYKKSNNP